jgi:hypothetical protein
MKLDDVRVVAEPLVRASAAEVDALEARYWLTLPKGYREYVTRLGEGTLGGFIRIYPPWRIEKELAEWRRRIDKYWFWDAGRDVLPKERALECVVVGDTVNGDEIVFHPGRPDRIFVLPRQSEVVRDAGPDLLSAVDWICTSGELVEPIAKLDFEPFDSRNAPADDAGDAEQESTDPPGESLKDLVAAAQRWVERHGVRESARKRSRPFGSKERKLELIHESLVIDGRFPNEPGYAIAWRIIDKQSGLELGVYRWHKSESGEGSAYEPNNANLAKLRGEPGGS